MKLTAPRSITTLCRIFAARVQCFQLTPAVLEEYYFTKIQSGLSGSTIRKHHSNIKMTLKFAVKNGLTDHNAALLAELPCTDRYCGNFISTDQFEIILNKVKNTDLYTPVFLSGTMGLRRSEVLGLRWSDINFETQTMCIQHTVVKCIKDHKITLVFSDVPKPEQAAEPCLFLRRAQIPQGT